MSLRKTARRARRSFTIVLVLALGAACGILLDRSLLAGVVPGSMVSAGAVNDFRLMAFAWNLIDSRYVDPDAIKPRKMTYAAISGMVDSLGDTGHSTFLTPQMVALSKDVSTGNFAGIGAEIGVKKGRVVIVSPIDGTPASRAGLRPGDVILAVDAKSIASLSLSDVVSRIRGPVGTSVTLQILPAKAEKPHEVTLVRAEIPIDTVHWSPIPGTSLADVRISSFAKGTSEALAKALEAVKDSEATGIVLDLRDDPGGLLEEAIGVTSLFVDQGVVLKDRDRAGKVTTVPVEPGGQVWKGPLAVLINGGTASAAEIVAGALRDRRQAPLIGEKSFGTGTVLQEFPLPDGSAMLLAVGEWLTPNGESFWHKGLKPTTEVALADDSVPLTPMALRDMTPAKLKKSDDTQLMAGVKALEQAAGTTAGQSTGAPAPKQAQAAGVSGGSAAR
jgi:carboxyl-terminal processing protease